MQDSNFAIHFKALAILRASISVGVPPSWAFPLEPRDPRELVWSLRFSSWLKSNFTVSLKLENKLMKIDTYRESPHKTVKWETEYTVLCETVLFQIENRDIAKNSTMREELKYFIISLIEKLVLCEEVLCGDSLYLLT